MPTELFIDRLHDIVRAHGNRPALVVDGAVTHTYRQLWDAAETAAAGLQARGATTETVVGVQLPRSAELIVTMVGTWRAGAAYLPLDPALPEARSSYMIANSGAQLVVRDVRELSGSRFEPPALSATDLAYVIYTSGTSGQPKGVAVEHRGLVGLLDAQIDAFQLRPDCRVLFLLSPGFDASISDIGTTLLSGAALCIESKHHDQRMAPAVVGDLLRERQITHVDIPPALLARLDDRPLPALRTIVIGGEPCPAAVVRRWVQRCRVVNVYGPTEVTICTSLCVCDSETWSRPLLGQPIDGVGYRIEASNSDREGELLIAGPGLARGYVGDARLTQARFVTSRGRRWYRTGDLVRIDPDGEFVFLGRIDRQLKLRGHRIEPEEIEAALAAAAGVMRCAVVARALSATSSRPVLVAFLEGPGGDERDAAALRPRLEQTLPAWMIPSRLVWVDELPQTPSGKVDFERLGAMPLAAPGTVPDAASLLERQLLAIWQDALGLACDVDDDFFELGADSLALLDVIALAQSRGICIPPALIAAERTVRRISARLNPERLNPDREEYTDAISADTLRDDIQTEMLELRRLAARQQTRLAARPAQRCILLTGATGFLGSRVLEQLLARTDDRIVCLVRGRDSRNALDRLQDTVREQQLNISASDFNRVEVVAADLAERNCGLAHRDWRRLADSTGTIFHCAARVQLLEDYAALRPANVSGLAQVMRLAVSGVPKKIHYASTLSVFVGTDRNRGRLVEADDLSATQWVFGGYAQSKWAAEVLLRGVGLPIGRWTAYRFGLLAFDARTGAIPPNDLLTLAIRGLDAAGCVPNSVPEVQFDLTPVDFAARAMVHLGMLDPAQKNSTTYHVANSRSVSFQRLVRCLLRLRPAMRELAPEAFLRRVQHTADPLQATAILALCRGLATLADLTHHRQLDLFQATGVEFDTTYASHDLQGSGILCPEADDRLVTFLLHRILD